MIRKIAYNILLATVGLMALFATFLLSLPLTNSYLQNHHTTIESLVEKLVHSPVTIRSISITNYGYKPVIKFDQVDVKNKALKFDRVQFGIDVWSSLLNFKLVPGYVFVFGLKVDLQQDASGKVFLNGFPFNAIVAANRGSLSSRWLSKCEIYLRNVDLTWRDNAGKSITLNNLDAGISGNVLTHKLYGRAELFAKGKTKLQFVINFDDNSDADGYLDVQNINFAELKNISQLKKLPLFSGSGKTEVWFRYADNKLQRIAARFDLQNVGVSVQSDLKIPKLKGNFIWEAGEDEWLFTGDKLNLGFDNFVWPQSKFAAVFKQVKQKLRLDTLAISFLRVENVTAALGDKYVDYVKHLRPGGELHNVVWQRTDDGYIAAADIVDLSLQRWQNIPAFAHLSGKAYMRPNSGVLQLNTKNSAVDFGGLFRNQLLVSGLQGRVDWQRSDAGLTIASDNLRVTNEDLALSGAMNLFWPKGEQRPYLDLLASFHVVGVKNAGRYYPVKIMRKKLVHWLDNSIRDGESLDGAIVVRGDLAKFPFVNKQGRFLIDTRFSNLVLDYKPGWPQLKNIYGDMIFDAKAMHIGLDKGTVGNIPVDSVQADIANLTHADLQVASLINSSMQLGQKFLHNSPLRVTVASNLAGIDMYGPMNLDLRLAIPLYELVPQVKVNGKLTLTDNFMQLRGWHFGLKKVKGDVYFTEKSLYAKQLLATLLGQPAELNINTQRAEQGKRVTLVRIGSKFNVAALAKAFHLPLSSYMHGQAEYRALLHLRDHRDPMGDILSVVSDLHGIEVNLPGALHKRAEEITDFGLSAYFGANNPMRFVLHYGEQPEDFGLKIIPSRGSTRIALQNDNVQGDVILPKEFPKKPLQILLDRLSLQQLSSGESFLQPRKLPPLHLVCNNLDYAGKHFGKLELDLQPNDSGVLIKRLHLHPDDFDLLAVGKWDIAKGKQKTELDGKFRSDNFGDLLNKWNVTSNLKETKGEATFALSWFGALFQPKIPTMRGNVLLELKHGRITNLNEETESKIGVGRILNLLSLQTLQRRLNLDFSDLTKSGFSFDKLRGELELSSDNLYSKNIYLEGPVADVIVQGKIGIQQKDYHAYLTVTPHVTSSLPVVATIAGGPIAGAIAWFANKVLSHEVQQVVTHKYRVVGTWQHPNYVQLNKA